MATSSIYLLPAVPVVGGYLLGTYAWPTAQRLGAVRVRRPAGAGALTVTLEVAGVLGTAYPLPATAAESEVTWTVAREVRAGAAVRWQVTEYTEGAEPTGLALMLEVTAVVVARALTVRWVQGAERLDLFTYAAGTFTAAVAALALGRAGFTPVGGGLTITLAGVEVLRGAGDGTLYTAAVQAGAGVATEPRLEFLVGGGPIAWLSPTGLTVPAAHQATPAENPEQFWLGGVALNAQGVVAERFAPL